MTIFADLEPGLRDAYSKRNDLSGRLREWSANGRASVKAARLASRNEAGRFQTPVVAPQRRVDKRVESVERKNRIVDGFSD